MPTIDPHLFGGVAGNNFFLWEMQKVPYYTTLKYPVSHSIPTDFRYEKNHRRKKENRKKEKKINQEKN